jgi:hypothetical protein
MEQSLKRISTEENDAEESKTSRIVQSKMSTTEQNRAKDVELCNMELSQMVQKQRITTKESIRGEQTKEEVKCWCPLTAHVGEITFVGEGLELAGDAHGLGVLGVAPAPVVVAPAAVPGGRVRGQVRGLHHRGWGQGGENHHHHPQSMRQCLLLGATILHYMGYMW